MGRVSEKARLRKWILSRHLKRDQGEDHCWHKEKACASQSPSAGGELGLGENMVMLRSRA